MPIRRSIGKGLVGLGKMGSKTKIVDNNLRFMTRRGKALDLKQVRRRGMRRAGYGAAGAVGLMNRGGGSSGRTGRPPSHSSGGNMMM